MDLTLLLLAGVLIILFIGFFKGYLTGMCGYAAKGFSLLITLLSWTMLNPLAEWILHLTKMDKMFYESCLKLFEHYKDVPLKEVVDKLSLNLPENVIESIELYMLTDAQTTLAWFISSRLTKFAAFLVATIIVICCVKIFYKVLIKPFTMFSMLNRLTGALVGVSVSALCIYGLFFLLVIAKTHPMIASLTQAITNNEILNFIYEKNPLVWMFL